MVRRATEAETTTHTPPPTTPVCWWAVFAPPRSRPAVCRHPAATLPPRCRHPAATMWSASMPSPCLTLLYGGHDGMKWDAAVVAGVWRAYLGA